MKIAMIHFRVGATDGVSLEMDKWKTVLENLGHTVIYVAGTGPEAETRRIEHLSLKDATHKKIDHNAFETLDDYEDEKDLLKDIFDIAHTIRDKLMRILKEERIDLIIPNNVSSLGLNLPAAIAIKETIDHMDLRCIYHHHDFFWERERYAHPTTPLIDDLLKRYVPASKGVHCVINNIAKTELKARKGIDSIVVPNVFDFEREPWIADDYNRDLRGKLGIAAHDLVFLQATRIEDRKAIELAIDTIERFKVRLEARIGDTLYNGIPVTKNTRVFLLIAGMNELREDKFKILKDKIDRASFEIRLINDIVAAKRDQTDEKKVYALWDIYPACDFVTYPSILEGWGNQFIEAVFAQKPVLAYEYPVFQTDIKPLGFDVVSLGDEHEKDERGVVRVKDDILDRAAKEIESILFDGSLYAKIVEKNERIARHALSFDRLAIILKGIMDNI
jgi:mannosylglucosylglycerate synthase